MIRLQWSNICEDSEGMHIELRQKKTAGLLHIPIKDTAIHYLGERDADESLVFETLKNKKEYNNVIAEWVQAAGIKKNITFHCFRHSFAMMLLQSGVGIYELSRMLGHKSLTMTQVYLRMLDEDRRKAINKIPI
jgi:integrase